LTIEYLFDDGVLSNKYSIITRNRMNIMLTRRKFIKKSIYSTSAVFMAESILPSFNILQQLLASDNAGTHSLSDKEKFLLKYASLAPSGHNTQPWNVKIVSDSEWIIGWDKNRALPAVDPHNRELTLSIGAFCEALSISAESIGLQVTKKITGANSFAPELVKIFFKSADKHDGLMYALQKRRTIKNGLLEEPLRPDDVQFIRSGIKSEISFFHRGSREASAIERAVLESNIIQSQRDDAQEELATWIRWKDSDASKYKNGLTPGGMEISGIGGWYVKHFYSKEDVMTESFRNQTIQIIEKLLSSYGSWIVISTATENPGTLIDAGGDFLRLGLNSYDKKIALHPMTQPLEENGFAENLKKTLKIDGRIQFILRAGYVETYPGPVSLRMPAESIVL
jgi:hypothetical protein